MSDPAMRDKVIQAIAMTRITDMQKLPDQIIAVTQKLNDGDIAMDSSAVKGAVLEVKTEACASWLGDLANDWNMRLSNPDYLNDYKELLGTLNINSAKIDSLVDAGSSITWSVSPASPKGIDTRLIATDSAGNYVGGVAFECKNLGEDSWRSEEGFITQPLRQIALAAAMGEPLDAYVYVMRDLGTSDFSSFARSKLMSFRSMNLPQDEEIPDGLSYELNNLAFGVFFNDIRSYKVPAPDGSQATVIYNPTFIFQPDLEGILRIAEGQTRVLCVNPDSPTDLSIDFDYCKCIQAGVKLNFKTDVGATESINAYLTQPQHLGIQLWDTVPGGGLNWQAVSVNLGWILVNT
jgi:hypothetical protein